MPVLGMLIGLDALYALITGKVFAKHGAWGRTVFRADEPVFYWFTTGVYTVLSVLLITVF